MLNIDDIFLQVKGGKLYVLKKKNEISHHGVKGQKWGVRRYQNKDGSLTSAGKARYYVRNNDNAAREKAYEKISEFRTNLLNSKYNDISDDDYYTERGQEYLKEISAQWHKVYTNELKNVVPKKYLESARAFIQNNRYMDEFDWDIDDFYTGEWNPKYW